MKKTILNLSVGAVFLTCVAAAVVGGDVLDFQAKTAAVDKIKVKLDFPAEGRTNKNGKGYSANVELLNPKPKKVGLISFYLYDPACGKSNNGTWTGVASSSIWRTPDDVAQTHVDGFYNKGIDALKAAFKEYNMDLLTPAEFLDTDEKSGVYYSFDQETAGFHKEKSKANASGRYTVASISTIKVCPTDKGYRPFFVANEKANESDPLNFANTGVFGANRKMTSSLGYDLCKELGLDAVVVCYVVTRKEKMNKNNYGVNAVNLYMFGPNPKSEGSDDGNRGQFYCGTRVFYGSPLQFQDHKTNAVTFEGFQNIMTAMGKKVGNWVMNKEK